MDLEEMSYSPLEFREIANAAVTNLLEEYHKDQNLSTKKNIKKFLCGVNAKIL